MNVDEATIPIQESYWVIPCRFRAGEYPGSPHQNEARKRLRWLLEQNTNFIIDLTEAGEAGLYPYLDLLLDEANKIQKVVIYKRMPIQDFNTPPIKKMVEILDALDSALAEGMNIYLHCYGGKGRTGMVLGCHLVRHETPANQALNKILALRSEIPGRDEQSPETEGQKRMVMEWKQGQ
jgi:protein-tyrosine phosphatase